jgi:hypothetical protein
MGTKASLPEFKGKPLIEIPAFTPSADFLEGDFGREVNEAVQKKYGEFKAISKIKFRYLHSNGRVVGSNPFYVVAVNEVIRREGLRTATPADLERILKVNALDLSRFYIDSALVLISEGEPNSYLARNLMTQIKKGNKRKKMPVMIPLSGLKLFADSDSSHGLSFKIAESKIVYSPILNKSGNFKSEEIDEKTGLPSRLVEGNRILYTRNNGLSGLCLFGGSNLNASYECLACSRSDGRVVVFDAEGVK